MMMLIPLPAVLLDVLLAANLVLALLIILTVLYTRHALEFSVFPTLLLIATVFGLALNVSSTRLILSKGSQFNGHIIRAFATFVVGTRGVEGYVIGLIIFIIIIAVQFIVITKGATRVAEVAARFTLDALPGKQMAIEAEYNSGLITEEEATRKKNNLQREADFYGSMDGASKFISGNVKVGILITVVQIVGGLIVGMTLHGEPLDVALNTYISLSIGDGLVTQLPALLISTATGIIVTRAISDASFGKDITKQFSAQSRPYLIAAAFLVLLSFLPGFPWYVLIPMGILIGVLGFSLTQEADRRGGKDEDQGGCRQGEGRARRKSPRWCRLTRFPWRSATASSRSSTRSKGRSCWTASPASAGNPPWSWGSWCRASGSSTTCGWSPPSTPSRSAGSRWAGARSRWATTWPSSRAGSTEEVQGEPTKDPAFGLPAVWIAEEDREKAERLGYTVVDPPSIIATHLTEIIKRYAAEILGRQEVQSILDALKTDYPAVVEEVKKVLSVGEIQKVLQGLLTERVSVRNMVVILETLADYGSVTKDVGFLIEKVRQALGRQICLQYATTRRRCASSPSSRRWRRRSSTPAWRRTGASPRGWIPQRTGNGSRRSPTR